MNKQNSGDHEEQYKKDIRRKQRLKLKGKHEKDRSVMFGLGMFGLVGWSVATPAVILTFIGIWIDDRFPGRPSWTLILLFLGILVGCLTAWRWVKQESREDR